MALTNRRIARVALVLLVGTFLAWMYFLSRKGGPNDVPLFLAYRLTRTVPSFSARPMFNSPEVLKFRDAYRKRMQDPLATGTMTMTFFDIRGRQGFGSFFNMFIAAFQYSQEPNVLRQVHLNTDTFKYGNWSDYFEDPFVVPFERNGKQVKIGLELQDPSMRPKVTERGLEVKYMDGVPVEQNHPRIQHIGFNFQQRQFFDIIYRGYNSHLKNRPIEDNIHRRRLLAQSVWELKPHLRQRLLRIQERLPAADCLTIHIRRGDKVKTKEMRLVPVHVYTRKAGEILREASNKIRAIVIITDDEVAVRREWQHFQRLQDEFGVSVQFFDELQDNSERDIMATSGWDQQKTSGASAQAMRRHTESLVLSITLMAQGSQTICTYTSNLCRMVQLLRVQPFDTLHSVDYPYFVMH